MSRLRVRFVCRPESHSLRLLDHALPSLDPQRFDCKVWTPPSHTPFATAGRALRRWLRTSGCDLLHVLDASSWPRWFSRGLAGSVLGPAETASLRWGVDAQRIEGLATRHLNPHPPARRDVVKVVVPAPLEGRRGHDVLWAALTPLEQGRPMDLWLVGDGPERARIKRRASRFSSGSVRVHMLGARDDLYALIRSADFTVLPQGCEEGAPLPVTLLESRVLGRPVVATAGPGVPEAVTPAEDGLLVPPGDPLALARALARLATCAELRRELGTCAARDARERFDARDTASSLEALYLGKLDRTGRARPNAIRPAVSS